MEHSESRDFVDGESEIGQEVSPRVGCFWCERLHPGEHPLVRLPGLRGQVFDDAIAGNERVLSAQRRSDRRRR